jgi:hypothetical protein
VRAGLCMVRGTLTPALSQRERERGGPALSQRERERGGRALSQTALWERAGAASGGGRNPLTRPLIRRATLAEVPLTGLSFTVRQYSLRVAVVRTNLPRSMTP